ncbi:carbohydrate ABC transporter substrate-binding protein [Herbiconiux sp. VKM Ac-1786]|uniref:carbohydrate ABC transporter substrate-binding protein n=1 Tax=Herbiconiux sp. VKM Ac-1786 TaxID=2783824 RepID=UPI00188AC914|nr:carbohydrate ABC transporter substrate-binding protein [Herbiconiux sp. VKM Ac-1786]MBF4572509.1 carbohydrate ABC transporter substrate-binding protein [Herbiconiux sp. VKM Ac-1786]
MTGTAPSYRGITWDHPRGRDALRAAAAADASLELDWQAHSLEHFESHPIDELARDFDLIVLDHPHLGEALELGSLQPMEDVVGPELLERWAGASVGPSFESYRMLGRQWALPLDAATQVAALRTDLLPGVAAPATWAEVEQLAAEAPVALSLAGPHAFLSFASICAALGEPVADHPDLPFVSTITGSLALDILRSIGGRAPAGSATQNPIALLERMTSTDEIAYLPLVYGYVTYSTPVLRFADAPAALPGGRRGSTIGGTGIAVSRRAEVTPQLVAHITRLLSEETQRDFIPRHAGQPSARSAWTDPEVDRAASGFYASTLATIESSWVRPRYSGYIPFQSAASALVREVVAGALPVAEGLERLRSAFRVSVRARSAATEPVRAPVPASRARTHPRGVLS